VYSRRSMAKVSHAMCWRQYEDLKKEKKKWVDTEVDILQRIMAQGPNVTMKMLSCRREKERLMKRFPKGPPTRHQRLHNIF